MPCVGVCLLPPEFKFLELSMYGLILYYIYKYTCVSIYRVIREHYFYTVYMIEIGTCSIILGGDYLWFLTGSKKWWFMAS